MTSGISIRQASDSDFADISSVLHEAAGWLADRGTPLWKTDVQLAPAEVGAHVRSGMYWLAEVDGASAGCLRFQTQDAKVWPDVPEGESAFIHRLAVRRAFAGGQVSRELFAWAKSYAQMLNKYYLRLDCESHRDRLRAVYERAGFREHSERMVGPYRVTRYELNLRSLHEHDRPSLSS